MSWWQKLRDFRYGHGINERPPPDTEHPIDSLRLRRPPCESGVPPKPAISGLMNIVEKLIEEKSQLLLRVAQLEQENRDLQSQLQRMIHEDISR